MKSRYMVLLVVACILGLLWITSLGGWQDLAKKYPHQPPVDAKTFRFDSVWMWADHSSSYHVGLITVQADLHYIHLSTTLFFYFPFHPPLSIPWSAVTECERNGSGLKIHLSEPEIALGFRGEVGSHLQDLCVKQPQFENVVPIQ